MSSTDAAMSDVIPDFIHVSLHTSYVGLSDKDKTRFTAEMDEKQQQDLMNKICEEELDDVISEINKDETVR